MTQGWFQKIIKTHSVPVQKRILYFPSSISHSITHTLKYISFLPLEPQMEIVFKCSLNHKSQLTYFFKGRIDYRQHEFMARSHLNKGKTFKSGIHMTLVANVHVRFERWPPKYKTVLCEQIGNVFTPGPSAQRYWISDRWSKPEAIQIYIRLTSFLILLEWSSNSQVFTLTAWETDAMRQYLHNSIVWIARKPLFLACKKRKS